MAILELIFGSWIFQKKINQLVIIRNKVVRFDIENVYPSEYKTAKYTRDHFGLRGEYPNIDSINIFTVGGSTTDQHYISDGYTWQDVLQNNFINDNKQVYVVNAGVDGQSTYGHLKNFDYWFSEIPNLKPDYFLFYIGVNDFYKNAEKDQDKIQNEQKNFINKIKSNIKNRSATYSAYQIIKNIFYAYEFGLLHNSAHKYQEFSTQNWTSDAYNSGYKEILKDRLLSYEERIYSLIDKVKSYDAKPIFVTQSRRRDYDFIDGTLIGRPKLADMDGFKYNSVDYYYMIRLYHASLEKICIENDAIFIDLDAELKFDIKNDFYDSMHNTPSGAKKIGDFLFTKLVDLYK